MALDSALISGADLTGYFSGCPMLLKTGLATTCKWCNTGASGDDDDTDTDYPVSAAYDGHSGRATRPNDAQQVWWFRAVLPSSTVYVDSFFIHLLDLDESDVETTTTIYISDESTDEQITSWDNASLELVDGSPAKRMFVGQMYKSGDTSADRRRWTGATVLKIKFDAGAGNTCRPQLLEVAVGRGYVFPHQPLYPDDELNRTSSWDTAETVSGIVQNYIHHIGRQTGSCRFQPNSAASAQNLFYAWNSTNYGASPFVWARRPLTEYTISNMTGPLIVAADTKELKLAREDYGRWALEFSWKEQGGRFADYEDPYLSVADSGGGEDVAFGGETSTGE